MTTNDSELSPEYRTARCQVRRLRGFYYHLVVYLAVNAGLLAVNLLKPHEVLWSVWPLTGWGVAVLIHGAVVFLRGNVLGADWEKRKIAQIMERKN